MAGTTKSRKRGPSLILIELNELAPPLIARFMADGDLPNFKRFHDASTVYVTDAGEDPPNLEPWIAWPAIHCGVEYGRHKAFHLGDGRKIPFKGVARLLSDANVRVGVFGSMNTNYSDLNGYYIPDPWDTRAQASPASLAPYFNFVARQVQEHTKSSAGGDALGFLRFLVRNGLSIPTVAKIAWQLVKERRAPGTRWRRALMLDHLGYDVFRSLNARFDVGFATFFSNSVAHFQHYFWRNMDPDAFLHEPDPRDDASLRDAIRDGYRTMDVLLGRLMKDYPASTLVFATALSQQPWSDTTKYCYRPHDFDSFKKFAGIEASAVVKPVMAEAFQIDCVDAASVERTTRALAGLAVRAFPAMEFSVHGTTVFTGCSVNQPDDGELMKAVVTSANGSVVRFGELFYQITTMRSGRHHRDGCLWVRNGRHTVVDGRLPLTEIAPMILNHFGVAIPDYMIPSEAAGTTRLVDRGAVFVEPGLAPGVAAG